MVYFIIIYKYSYIFITLQTVNIRQGFPTVAPSTFWVDPHTVYYRIFFYNFQAPWSMTFWLVHEQIRKLAGTSGF